ncbi:hypothetical protein T03_10634 [Trichinella britovi]|uniref:Uncharacterized protein n=1 Tax=Trichinella britovi TaxID=45882 RepID=A0A0V1BM77_TRIBR|nr:hypothetical protein T03_10634 [Trichinella britovi]
MQTERIKLVIVTAIHTWDSEMRDVDLFVGLTRECEACGK